MFFVLLFALYFLWMGSHPSFVKSKEKDINNPPNPPPPKNEASTTILTQEKVFKKCLNKSPQPFPISEKYVSTKFLS